MGKAGSVKFSLTAKGDKANGREDDKRVVITKVTKRSPSVESSGESLTGATSPKLTVAEKNRLLKEKQRHTSRIAGPAALGTANPVFIGDDPFWNSAWQLVNPRHKYIQWWDLLTLNLLVFTALVTPYEIAFMDGANGINVQLLFWVNQIINLIFILDMALVFVMPYEGKDGVWVTNKRKLAMTYFKGMFIIDLLSVMPFDIVAATSTNSNVGDLKVLRVLKLFRLLKMLRIFRGLKIVKRYEADFAVDYQALNISMLLAVLVIVAHWIACLLALICKYDTDSPDLEVYMPAIHVSTEEPSTFKSYFYCFKWGLMWIAAGAAEGHDEEAEGSLLRGYCASLLIVGAIANAAIIGGVMTVVDELNNSSREFYGNLNTLNLFLKKEDVSNRVMKWRNEEVPGKEFCRRLRKFYLFKYSHISQYESLGTILENVSDDMKRVMAEAMYGDILRGCGVFKMASADMIAFLSVNIRVNIYARGDFIYSVNEPSNDLFFCIKGTIFLPLRVKGRAVDVYRGGGEPFGQEVIYKLGQPRGRSALCSTEAVIMALSGEAVHEAIDLYGEHSLRWRVFMTRNLMFVSGCLKKAVVEVLRNAPNLDVDAGVAHLEDQLGRNCMTKVDATGHKENNLLLHLKRLTMERLLQDGYSAGKVEMMLASFEPYENDYDDAMEREVVAQEKFEDLRHLLEYVEDEEDGAMSKYFETFVKEKIETVEALKTLTTTDLKAIGMPLGHAVLIFEAAKNSASILADIKRKAPKEKKRTVVALREGVALKSFKSQRSLTRSASGSSPGAPVDEELAPPDDEPTNTGQACWTPSIDKIFGRDASGSDRGNRR